MKSQIIKDYKKTINQEQIYIYMYEKNHQKTKSSIEIERISNKNTRKNSFLSSKGKDLP